MTGGEIRDAKASAVLLIERLADSRWVAAGDALEAIQRAVEGAIRFHKYNREPKKERNP
jgi:hypothetical protein